MVALIAALTAALVGCDSDFLQAGFNSTNAKFNPESGVTATNVSTLHQRWAAEVSGDQSSRSTPAVATIDKVKYVYVSTSDGFLEKRRADTGAAVWAVDNHSDGTHDLITPSSSPAVTTPAGTTQTQVVIGSLDGHVYSYDARTGAKLWQFPTTFNDLVPVTTSPTVMPDGMVLVSLGERISHNFHCASGSCTASVLWTVTRLDPATGNAVGGWGLGTGFLPTNNAGDLTSGWAFDIASSPAYDPTNDIIVVGEPNTYPGSRGVGIEDYQSGVLALHGWIHGLSFAWEQRWITIFNGVSAAPAIAGGRVFVSGLGGLRAFTESSGAMTGPVGPGSSSASPAVAGDTVYAATDNGYLKAYNVNGLAQRWTSGQAVDGNNVGVPTGSPVVVGVSDSNGVVPLLVYNVNSNGDLKAWNAIASGTNGAIVTVNAHSTGRGGVAVSAGVVYVNGSDGQLRAFGI